MAGRLRRAFRGACNVKLTKINIGSTTDPVELSRLMAIVVDQLNTLLNAGLLFSDNFNAKFTSVTFSQADTEQRIEHNLGRVASSYLVLNNSANAVVYSGVSENSNQFLFLRASAPCTVSLMIF